MRSRASRALAWLSAALLSVAALGPGCASVKKAPTRAEPEARISPLADTADRPAHYGGPAPVSQGEELSYRGVEVREGVASIFGGPGDRGALGLTALTGERVTKIGRGRNPALDYYCALRVKGKGLANSPVIVALGKRAIACRLVDRGPYHGGRLIDISPAMARELGFKGLARVKVALGAPGTPIGAPFDW